MRVYLNPCMTMTCLVFFVEFRKNIFNESYLKSQGLNERQIKTVILLKEKGRITNKEYQELFAISRETASRDLAELTEKGMFENLGGKGAGSYFKLK